MMMTYFHIKPWLSNGMIICDRPSIIAIQTIHSAGLYTFVHYIRSFTNLVIITVLRRYRLITLVFALCFHCSMMVSKRGNAEQHVPVCSCFTSCGGFEY